MKVEYMLVKVVIASFFLLTSFPAFSVPRVQRFLNPNNGSKTKLIHLKDDFHFRSFVWETRTIDGTVMTTEFEVNCRIGMAFHQETKIRKAKAKTRYEQIHPEEEDLNEEQYKFFCR